MWLLMLRVFEKREDYIAITNFIFAAGGKTGSRLIALQLESLVSEGFFSQFCHVVIYKEEFLHICIGDIFYLSH